MARRALLQVADTGPLDSLVYMLRDQYRCYLPGPKLRRHLAEFGGLVLAPEDLQRSMGYDKPGELPIREDLDVDLYVDVKAHMVLRKLTRQHGHLRGRVLWYRINGGAPEAGSETEPGCPILTPNMHYCGREDAYAFWPRLVDWDRYQAGRTLPFASPICLIHNVRGWGYQDLLANVESLGVRLYGRGSPSGLVPHSAVPAMLRSALCMVHLKSNDAPGYALLEAMASACPVVCTRRLIWRCRMQELLEPGATCLTFDRETHDGLSDEDVRTCTAELDTHLRTLRDWRENRRIGEAGRERLHQLMWSDREGFDSWMGRMFP